ncbi:MAG: cyclodeaminase/cyclohydrolase family protein [Candidatus Omnitrophica bacterium]|nr:cyclodeaminase/cyclohydrolase family protein [Candidatus Omnitrophota bacterium]
MYLDKPLRQYLDDLAAKKPAPGGGSAAALAAAIGTSLMSMVANYTVGKPKYKDVEAKVADILLRVQNFDSELRSLVDDDVAAYKKLSEGLKAACDDKAKKEALYKAACEVPFKVCEISAKCLKLCKELAESGNRNLVTDTAIAAILLEGAFFSAKYNVYINLECIEDMDYIGKVHQVLAPLEESIPELKEEILEICEDVIDTMECK